ncbi:hypothetical protein A1O3_09337 [Capronia epimyces CBS 606.96]|uniref:Uncharacterized protein n=1 Tax=Capronia epimyces CBS 606.96 TaxID=1182542 RepID=W9XMH1_9EURO|nr:uncharacterized protein A1O3_09337 [Capronia epimyces CBS 606.96]EXJ78176.1 hypothetical protein A1O3_09337 [Capronia epimyces CBS 606.96]
MDLPSLPILTIPVPAVFANAGLVGLEPFYKIQTLPPKKPQMVDNEVNTVGVYYTCYLAMHYMRQNPVKGGQIIITSSAAGIYPSYSIPLYTASKHAVVGFMRCLAPVLLREGIRVNATLPGAVKTPFMSEEGWAAFPESMFTTLDNIVGGVNKLLDDPDASGVALEISQGNYYPRPQHEWSDEAQKLICTAAGKFDPDTML